MTPIRFYRENEAALQSWKYKLPYIVKMALCENLISFFTKKFKELWTYLRNLVILRVTWW